MGEVLFLWDGDQRLCAAKTFKDGTLSAVASLSERFVHEARVWLDLRRHQNIVEAYCIEIIRGRPFVFLEFVAGGSLANRIAGAPQGLELEHVLRFAADICEGMAFAASCGLSAHRDLKPANCLLTEDGNVKVTDFGLALWPKEPGTSWNHEVAGATVVCSRLTLADGFLGTPAYMAPEQFVDARQADLRSDVYSLGVLLFEMATGQLPFRGQSLAELEALHRQAPTPPLGGVRFSARSGRRFAKLVERCLQKDPKSRYQTFSEIHDEIADIYSILTGKHLQPAARETDLVARQHNNKAASFGRLGLFDRELVEADQAIRMAPGYGAAWQNRGAALVALGRHDEAIVALDQALKLSPERGITWSNKGVSLEALGRLDEALFCHDRAVAVSPEDSLGWTNKAATLVMMGRDDDALACLDRSLRLNPSSVAALVNLAYLCGRRREFEKAADCCQRAIRIDPKCARAWYVLGLASSGAGNQEQAIVFLQAAERLGFAVNWSELIEQESS
jgi:tetratricopeptide (TPR) repeat protein